MTDRVRAELRRTGGFAGRAVHVSLDSAQLPSADAAQLLRLVSELDLDRLPTQGPVVPGADLMTYDLTLSHGTRTWHGSFTDPAVPAQLRQLVQFLTASS